MLDQIKIDILDGIVKIVEDGTVNKDYREFLKFVYNYIDNNIEKRYVYNSDERIGILNSLSFDNLFIHYINMVNEFKTIYEHEYNWKNCESAYIFYEIPNSKLEEFKIHFDEKITSDTYFTLRCMLPAFYSKVEVKEMMLQNLAYWINSDDDIRNLFDTKKMHIVRNYIDKNLLHKE